MDGNHQFFRSNSEVDASRNQKARKRPSDGDAANKPEEVREQYLRQSIIEFIGKTGIDPNSLDEFTLGEILDMIKARDEDAQIAWACSAQNPDLLPESIKLASEQQKKADNRARLKRRFEGIFPQ